MTKQGANRSSLAIYAILGVGFFLLLFGGYWVYLYVTFPVCISCSGGADLRQQGIAIGLIVALLGVVLLGIGNRMLKPA